MNALLIRALMGLFLLGPTVGFACPVCRPKVKAAIYNAHYADTLGLLLLPIAVLLAVGLGLYWFGSLKTPQAATSGSLLTKPLAS
jgi:hypothetical protein